MQGTSRLACARQVQSQAGGGLARLRQQVKCTQLQFLGPRRQKAQRRPRPAPGQPTAIVVCRLGVLIPHFRSNHKHPRLKPPGMAGLKYLVSCIVLQRVAVALHCYGCAVALCCSGPTKSSRTHGKRPKQCCERHQHFCARFNAPVSDSF